MMVVGITGPTGSGKTTALNVIRALGGCVLDLDAVYHGLLKTDQRLLDELDGRFSGVVQNGELDRKALGSIVFADKAALSELNAITGKYILAETDRQLELARQQELHITNIDIDSAACALAEENAAVNGLEDRVAVLRADLRDRTALPKAGSFDLCVANPPYFPPHTGRVAEGSRGTARSETACAFDQLCAAAAYLLRSGGRFCLVHRAERTAELMDVLRRHRLEPKVLRFVQKDAQTPPRLVLLSCRRHGGAGLAVHTPLLLQADGGESGELRRIYFKDRG